MLGAGTCHSNLGNLDASSANTSLRGDDASAEELEAAGAGAAAGAEKLNVLAGVIAAGLGYVCGCEEAGVMGEKVEPVEGAEEGAAAGGAATAGSEKLNEPLLGAGADAAARAGGALGFGALNENGADGGFAALEVDAEELPKLKLGLAIAGPRDCAGADSESELGESGTWNAADRGEGFFGFVAVYCGGTKLAAEAAFAMGPAAFCELDELAAVGLAAAC